MKRLAVSEWILFFAVCCIFFIFPKASMASERVEIPCPNPVGSGARAIGMGGAFIAVADDATAASWNPGGLIQLDKPEISIVGATFHRIEDNTLGNFPESSGDQSVSNHNLNFLSVSIPFSAFDQAMCVALTYQHLYDFTREWAFSIQDSDGSYTAEADHAYTLDGTLSAIGLSYCIQPTCMNRKLSIGLTVNIWDRDLCDNRWRARRIEGFSYRNETTEESSSSETLTTDHFSFSGLNMNLGFLWNITSKLTMGGVLKTPFKADVTYDYFERIADAKPTEKSQAMELEMPMSYGIGFAYRFSDTFTTSLDFYRTEWDDFILRDSDGQETSPVTGESPGDSDIDPAWQVRMGAEYLFVTSKYIIPLCLGAFYDPAPAQGSPDDFFGFSIGSGIGDGKHFTFDIAYQFRFGNGVGDSILQAWDFSQDVREHTVYSSLILYF